MFFGNDDANFEGSKTPVLKSYADGNNIDIEAIFKTNNKTRHFVTFFDRHE